MRRDKNNLRNILWRIVNILCILTMLFGLGYILHAIIEGSNTRNDLNKSEYITPDNIKKYQDKAKKSSKSFDSSFNRVAGGNKVTDVVKNNLTPSRVRDEKNVVLNSELIGRLTIPKIGVDEQIRLGASSEILKYSLGLVDGYDIPDDKHGYSSLVAGHRGYAGISNYFLYINRLKKGDRIYVERGEKRLVYEVTSNIVVNISDSDKVRKLPNKSLLTLVTCTPMFVWDKRILVESELVEVETLK